MMKKGKELCLACGCGLRNDSTHAPLCWKCWVRTPEGQREFKQINRDRRLREKWELWAS